VSILIGRDARRAKAHKQTSIGASPPATAPYASSRPGQTSCPGRPGARLEARDARLEGPAWPLRCVGCHALTPKAGGHAGIPARSGSPQEANCHSTHVSALQSKHPTREPFAETLTPHSSALPVPRLRSRSFNLGLQSAVCVYDDVLTRLPPNPGWHKQRGETRRC